RAITPGIRKKLEKIISTTKNVRSVFDYFLLVFKNEFPFILHSGCVSEATESVKMEINYKDEAFLNMPLNKGLTGESEQKVTQIMENKESFGVIFANSFTTEVRN
ncbi:MAG: hypothetical protein GXO02_05090, partial [Epsilonproteobacteria bacterium]|nr:hypothetical protein [Campylobacterota bacterium]